MHACRHMPVMRVKNRPNQVQRHPLALVLSALGLGLLVWFVVSPQDCVPDCAACRPAVQAVRAGCWLIGLPTCIGPWPGSSWQGRPSIHTADWAIRHRHAAFTRTPGTHLFLRAILCSQHLPQQPALCSRSMCTSDLSLFCLQSRRGGVQVPSSLDETLGGTGPHEPSAPGAKSQYHHLLAWHCWQRQVAVPAELH